MAYIGANPVNGFFEKQDLTTDGSTTTFTLQTTVGSSSAILVSVGGVIQEPEVAYNLGAGGTTIIFTEAPSSTADTYIHYLGQAIVQNLTDLNGVEMVLDVDADTTIHADTDDQIDFKLGGSDVIAFKTTGIHLPDSEKYVAGTGDDLQIYHDGSNSYIANAVGALKVATETSGIAVTIGHSTSEVTIGDNLTVTGDLTIGGTTNFGDFNITNVGSIALDTITNDGTDITLDSSGDIILDAAGNDIFFKAGGTTIGEIENESNNLIIKSSVSDADLILRGNDGGSEISALTFDMSAAGAATFNDKITAVGTSVFTNLDISGDVDVDGTLETDALTIGGVTLAETISDTVGAMVSSNTETGITVSYEDGDNTLDFALAAAQTTITSLLATDIKIGEDDQTKIDFETADEIHFYANNVEQVYLGDNIFGPQSDSDVDLGSNSVRWKDAYIDTITSTSTITTGAGIVIADAGNIGSASDTDAIAIASNGQVTLTQTLIGTALDISGDIDVDGTTNLDVVDIDGAVDMASTLQVDGAITSSAGATFTTADNTAQLTLESTDADASSGPVLDLFRNSGSPADSDSIGRINFTADNDAGTKTTFVRIKSSIVDASDGSEDAQFRISRMVAGGDRDMLSLLSSETVFNDSSQDIDFRVESNGQANAFKIDAGNDTASFAVPVDIDSGITIDNITIDGTEIDLSSGDLTVDVAGDIILDAAGNDVLFKAGGTTIGEITNSSSDLVIKSSVSDKDMLFKGNDGGSAITALTLDMSAAGAATFNNDVTAFSDKRLKDNVETIPNALDKVCAMRGVNFTRNDNNNQPGTGVIAQEMQEVFPVVVKENNDELNTLSVSYGNLVGVLIEAIKELKEEIENLKKDS